jgi:hypothetical protein
LNNALPQTMVYVNSPDHLGEVDKHDIIDKGIDVRKIISE